LTKINIFVYIQEAYTFIAPPFSAIFLLGMLWRRVSGRDVFVAVISSFIVYAAIKFMVFGPLAESTSPLANFIKPYGNQGLTVWVFAMITTSISALITPRPDPECVTDNLTFNWKKMNIGGGLGTKWYNSVLFWWAICFALMITFMIVFSVLV